MSLLLDQGLPRSAAALLRALGVEAFHTGEIGLATAADAVILEHALREGRIVVTLDADFHALLAFAGAMEPSIIRIRIEGLRAEALVALIRRVLDEYDEELELGAMVTVQPGRIRVRRLPLLTTGN